jgi:adenine-specific DNA-methyltransferase
MSEEQYYTTQIITYLGNKRKFISKIDNVITRIKKDLGVEKLNIGEGFSGSGVVSRLFKNRAKGGKFYVNDISSYSKILNECYLTDIDELSKGELSYLQGLLETMKKYVKIQNTYEPFISKYWAPKDDNNILPGERVYFSQKNAVMIDKIMYYIKNNIGEEYQKFFIGPLIVQASTNNNTNGQFSAYFKDENKEKGKFGGKNSIDLQRILRPIEPMLPILTNGKANVKISQKDANEWIRTTGELDLVYYDPPYNKHPYNIYYFLLDIISNWNTKIEIPDTYRGQPKNWIKSSYCSLKKARETFEDLIENTNSKFIMISYNSKGIIPLDEMDEILSKKGKVEKIPFVHNTYNRYVGIAKKKREKKEEKIKEFIWLVDCRKN